MSYTGFLLAHKYKIGRKYDDDDLSVWVLRHFCAVTWNEKSGIFQRKKKPQLETLHYLFPYNNNFYSVSWLCTELPGFLKKKKKIKISVFGIEPSVSSCVS